MDWSLDTQRDDGKGWHYSVVLWIHAPTVTDVSAQYMELAYRLGLRSASETGPEITSRVLTWLYKQSSYLIVFDRCDPKWNSTGPTRFASPLLSSALLHPSSAPPFSFLCTMR